MASPAALIDILVCAVCEGPFHDYPSTLPCGHSVCSKHVTKHTCNFRFSFTSSPSEPSQLSALPSLPTSPDVTLLKVNSLTLSALNDLQTPFRSDNEGTTPDNGEEPPRKRRRRRSSSSSTPPDEDLLSHLRTQSVRQRLTRQDQPLLPSHPPRSRASILENFNKELLSELSCEICFTLFYEPVTTPCQHVSSEFSCSNYPAYD
jgi:hypothetical protein